MKEFKFVFLKILIFLSALSPSFALKKVGPILETNWGQREAYAKYAPQNFRVGCWSTAFGQMLYHHELFPSKGQIKYKCEKKKITIDEVVGHHKYDLEKLTESMDEIAHYLFTVSLIIQKDFGTGDYVIGHQERADNVEDYYKCKTKVYNDLSRKNLEAMLVSEIDEGRPVLIHLRDKKKKSYHAAVVDGYHQISTYKFKFHINMGHGGGDDGWFYLDKPIDKYDDTSYHKIITLK